MIRLGLHRQSGDADDKFRDYVLRVRPPLVKQLDDRSNSLAEWCRQQGAETVARVYFDDQDIGQIGHRIARVVEEARTTPAIRYWELDNEDHQGGRELARYADASVEFMRAMDALGTGQKAAIGSFSCGQPALEDWPLFRPALDYAGQHQHRVALHEYSGPFMQWLAGENQWAWGGQAIVFQGDVLEDPFHEALRRQAMAEIFSTEAEAKKAVAASGHPVRVDDPCLEPDVLGWLTLRYRRAVAEWRRMGLATLPRIIITEGGIDDVQPRPGGQGKGYKDFAGTEWARIPGIGGIAQQQAWYCRQLSYDSAIVAGCVDYGFATRDPAWSGFDLSTDDATREAVVAAQLALAGPAPAPDPAPTPAPTPTPAPHLPAGPFAAGLAAADGEGLWPFCRRMYPGASDHDIAAYVKAIRKQNPGAEPLRAGRALLLPGYRLIKAPLG